MQQPPAAEAPTNAVRVAVVDDHESVRLGLKAAFAALQSLSRLVVFLAQVLLALPDDVSMPKFLAT